LLELPPGGLEPERELQLKRILGGMLLQQPDLGELKEDELRTVTKSVPTPKRCTPCSLPGSGETREVQCIVFAKDGATLGVGAGQMSRVDSVKLAVMKAQSSLTGTVVASDAFFPFRTESKKQPRPGRRPSSSPEARSRDPDVIAAADRLGFGHGLHQYAPTSYTEK